MHFSHETGNNQSRLQSQPEGFSRTEWVIIKRDFKANPRAFLAWNEGFWA